MATERSSRSPSLKPPAGIQLWLNAPQALLRQKPMPRVFVGPSRQWSTLRAIHDGVELRKALAKIRSWGLHLHEPGCWAFKDEITASATRFSLVPNTSLAMEQPKVDATTTRPTCQNRHCAKSTCHLSMRPSMQELAH